MKKCELLIPAGGMKQLIAAVENGADAVYMGGKLFNARVNAGNFGDEEMAEAVKFAHKRCVKVYVTMNTLVADSEMKQALEYAAFLYEIGTDALIIQDAGLGMMIKEIMPDFSLHLSTQGSIYDLRGVEAAARMGYDRVVTARELSLEEIKEICRGTDTEIEVFVHGAMCICYSGQCQMSRYFGGRSGNRGECAQPCRLTYKSFDADGRLLDAVKYPLSPKDLCLVNHIGDLIEAGVASLKIEGRMKSAEYVAVVTSIYRKYLDEYYLKGRYLVTPEDKTALEQIFNRGGFTQGYWDGNPEMELMSGDIPKHRGVRIGKVVKRVVGGQLVDVKLYDELSMGDGVEIQGEKPTGNVVTYIKELKGGLTRIGDIKGYVAAGDPLYKITSKSQMEAARTTFSHKSYDSGKFIKKTAVDMALECRADGTAELTINHNGAGKTASVQGGPFEKADKTPTDKAKIEQSLRKTGGTPFDVGEITLSGIFDRIIPISSINDMRRRALEKLETAMEADVSGTRQKVMIPPYADAALYGGTPQRSNAAELFFYDFSTYIDFTVPEELSKMNMQTAALIPVADFEENYDKLRTDIRTIPYISNISKGREDDYIRGHFAQIAAHCGENGIYVGGLSWVQPMKNAGVPVYGDYGLNVYNKFAADAYGALGIHHCAPSLESSEPGFGSYPLMISEHNPQGRVFIDRKKEKIRIVKRWFSSQTLLVPDKNEIDFTAVNRASASKSGIVRLYII